MRCIAIFPHAAAAVTCAAAMAMLPAYGGGDGADPAAESLPLAGAGLALEAARVSGRAEALRIVARGVVAPPYTSELAPPCGLRGPAVHHLQQGRHQLGLCGQ